MAWRALLSRHPHGLGPVPGSAPSSTTWPARFWTTGACADEARRRADPHRRRDGRGGDPGLEQGRPGPRGATGARRPGDGCRGGSARVRLYVAPDSAHRLTAQDRIRLADEAAATSPPTYVIVWAATREGGYRNFLDPTLQIAHELDRPGRYLVFEDENVWGRDVGIDGDYVSTDDFDEDEERTPAALAAKISANIAAGDDRDFSSESITHSDYWGGTAGAIGAGALMGVLGGAGLAIGADTRLVHGSCPTEETMMQEVPFTPDVEAIVEGLGSSPLYVDPSLASELTAEQTATITASIDAAPVPVHVIVVPLSHESELSPVQLVTLVDRQLPQDGIWYVTVQSYGGRWTVESTTYGVKVDNANNLASYVANDLYPTDLGSAAAEITELIAQGTARKEYDQLNRESSQQPPPPGESSSGVSLPVVAIGIGVLAVLVAVIATRRKRSGARHEVAVKGRALRRISTAQTDGWRHRAQTETDRLGERINAQQIDADADTAAWTAARPLRGSEPGPGPDESCGRLDRRLRAGRPRSRRTRPRRPRHCVDTPAVALLQPAARSRPPRLHAGRPARAPATSRAASPAGAWSPSARSPTSSTFRSATPSCTTSMRTSRQNRGPRPATAPSTPTCCHICTAVTGQRRTGGLVSTSP
ncbi:hypothetical protein [Aeromicrobium sp. UC242_57]|uniref:hypothetical protein n=1 Tax=Aeromicrobium sp. UC242_57 TaxID=3374624 RepID=UPI00379244A4